jgi:hypothetical protein
MLYLKTSMFNPSFRPLKLVSSKGVIRPTIDASMREKNNDKSIKNQHMKRVEPKASCFRRKEKQVLVDREGRRVDRVLGFLSSRPNWDSPTPSPAGKCVPPSFGSGGLEYTLACGRRSGGGGSQFRRGYTCTVHGTLGIYVLYTTEYI